MESIPVDAELLRELARHQAWADAAHWKALHETSTLFEDLASAAFLSIYDDVEDRAPPPVPDARIGSVTRFGIAA